MLQHPGVIALFCTIILGMLALDLGVLNRRSRDVTSVEAIVWGATWISLAMAFSMVILWKAGIDKFSQFQTCYWIEKALSVDNLFVFILVFQYFNVPRAIQHRVLFFGILGAIVMRAIFIYCGLGLIHATYLPPMQVFGKAISINLLLTLFGGYLIFAGYKSWFAEDKSDDKKDFGNSLGARLVQRFFPVTSQFDGDRFFTFQDGVRYATPLLVVVAVIEITDLLFAVDSIPAIFAVSDDLFVLYTSNIFAILGLRSLYFLLANFVQMFSMLRYGLAIILSFIGFKMLASPFLHISPTFSLSIVGGVLLFSTVGSLSLGVSKSHG